MKPLLSVIVPVYNARTYIRNSLNSLLSNKSTDFEVIVIDDGSEDDSWQIINQISQEDNRVRGFHNENRGPGATRNYGIKVANGDYLMFLDSDDQIDSSGFEYVLQLLNNLNADLVIFAFQIILENSRQTFLYSYASCEETAIYDLKTSFPDLYAHNLLNQVWGKIFSSEIIKNMDLSFSDYKYGEDRLFILDFLWHSRSIKIDSHCLYRYYIRKKESLITKFYEKKFEVCNLINSNIVNLQDKIGNFSDNGLVEINYMYLKSILSCMTNLYMTSCPYSRTQKRTQLKSILHNSMVQRAVQSPCKHGLFSIIRFIMSTKILWINALMAKSVIFMNAYFSTRFIGLKHPQTQKINVNASHIKAI